MPAQPLTHEQLEDAKRLKAIYFARRQELQLTQDALASLCGWNSQGTVSQYLNGKIPLNVDASAKLARHLKCSIDDFSPTMAQELRSLGDGLAPDEQNIIMPEAAAPTDPAPGLYAVEQRTVARPPLTRDEQAVLDGYRVAGEHDKKRVKEICVTALFDHGNREGEAQKKA
jgi:transcriptional regulator with XRE-family HTH domain